MQTIKLVKKKFIEQGMEIALERKPTNRFYERKVAGDVETKLVTLSCSDPPIGYAKWLLRLLADSWTS